MGTEVTNKMKPVLKRKISWSERNLGKYIHERLKEENLTTKDLDESTINFFFQQFKTEPFMEWYNETISNKKK